jgi:hypothetical protein
LELIYEVEPVDPTEIHRMTNVSSLSCDLEPKRGHYFLEVAFRNSAICPPEFVDTGAKLQKGIAGSGALVKLTASKETGPQVAQAPSTKRMQLTRGRSDSGLLGIGESGMGWQS